ncbi:mitochondrial thiamine pyrophosphate carrier-like [Cloeon dipterum]|uniref:mitochondrial thiamine pyrophosphate carrier-like n=1 Tax=Cloeon dipterum TaxID=197152 RepID=UPI0032200E67
MVGYSPNSEHHLTGSQLGIAGATSGAVSRALTQPLDVLKIRFQLQVEPTAGRETAKSKYRGVLQATRLVVKEEGVSALWKGHIPAQGLSLLYGASQFYTYELLTHYACDLKFNPAAFWVHFTCGALSGCSACFITNPLDVVRTRLIAQGEPKIYSGMTSAFTAIVRKEGFLAFYKGLTPSLILIAPQIGAVFACYEFFHDAWCSTLPNATGWAPLICGAMAGVCSKTLVYPLDLAKKRLQVTGFEHARKSFGEVVVYRGLGHVLWRTATKEGLHGLFKGVWPSVLKAAFTTGLQLAVYEQTCHMLVLMAHHH